jgi:hypothetical protein
LIHLDESKRLEAIEAGWRAYQERTPGHEADYRAMCEQWQVVAVCDDAEVIGALFARDGVIHIGIIPEYRSKWASRRVIRQMLSYGTRTSLIEGEDPTFIERIGFVKKGKWYELRR